MAPRANIAYQPAICAVTATAPVSRHENESPLPVPMIIPPELPLPEPPPTPSTASTVLISNYTTNPTLLDGDADTMSTTSDTSSHQSYDTAPKDCMEAPPSSILADYNRPTSPTGVRDFPEFPYGGRMAMPELYVDDSRNASTWEDLSDDDDNDSLDGDPLADCVVHVTAKPRIMGIADDRVPFCKTVTKVIRGMMDTGANFGMTNDLSLLVGVRDITPFSVGLACDGNTTPTPTSQCTKKGYLPLQMTNSDIYYQPMFYNSAATDTILSPQAIIEGSKGRFTEWVQSGNTNGKPGYIRFYSSSGLLTMDLELEMANGLYYCKADTFALDQAPKYPRTSVASAKPTTPAKQLEAELWAARLGFCGEWQLDVLPQNADGTPTSFAPHPFRDIEWKNQAGIRKQRAGSTPMKVTHAGERFYADFGFVRASAIDYTKPSKEKDRIVQSYDGFNSYLLVVDEISKHLWVFLTKSKDPPTDLMLMFLSKFGLPQGGILRTDNGGELAGSEHFRTMMAKAHYTVETTGADSPSQNGAVEKWNDTLAVTIRALLYGAGLNATFWSAALLHAVYLHNRRVHRILGKTPFEAWNGMRPNLKHLKMFGSRVCVKQTGHRRSKLDRHDFTGIFLGYTATNQNIRYIDVNSGITKRSHHAIFDEAWYLQPERPPAAQLLYNLGLDDSQLVESTVPLCVSVEKSIYPPHTSMSPPNTRKAYLTPLPLGLSQSVPTIYPARAATAIMSHQPLHPSLTHETMFNFGIDASDMAMVYLSPEPYNNSFEETLDIRKLNCSLHPTAGLSFIAKDNRIFLAAMSPSTPGARVRAWRTRLRGAWLIKIAEFPITTLKSARDAFAALEQRYDKSCQLLFAHSEIKDGLTEYGIPQVNLDQLNNRNLLRPDQDPMTEDAFNGIAAHIPKRYWQAKEDGGVVNSVTISHKLTRGKLLQMEDWDEWQDSEYKQLDQYELQGMFGTPCKVDDVAAIFNLIWTYNIKELDARKKARCACDGSTRAGQVRVIDHTYANSVDQTGSRIFWSIAAVENMVVYGSDVVNAFGEAPPPKQHFFVYPDKAFRDWWTTHKGRPPIPRGYVIPILRAYQGHPESPRLWEKYVDKIIKDNNFTSTVHEPCLYSGYIEGERVLFMRQVDDFAVAVQSERIANILFDAFDDKFTIPIKRQGLIGLYNGVNISQTRDYVKLSCESYLRKVCEAHMLTWMKNVPITADRPTPLPTTPPWNKAFSTAMGDPSTKAQAALEEKYQFGYRSAIGELIYAMVTCRPDISYAVVKCAQSSACPAEIHFQAVRSIFRYLHATADEGIYYWRTHPRMDLPDGPTPTVTSNPQDILMEGRPPVDPDVVETYVDSDWGTCPRTRRSFGGICIRMAGGAIAYKSRLQSTVALSSTEAEFMAACDAGKMSLFVRSILYDLGIPQVAATLLYEDNDAATAMANAGKPTPRTRHMDIKFHALCEWVERDLLILQRVSTHQNLADHFTKSLSRILFHRHVDFIMGHVPPPYSPKFSEFLRVTTLPPSAATREEVGSSTFAAAAAKLESPWDLVIFDSSPLQFSADIEVWGGDSSR